MSRESLLTSVLYFLFFNFSVGPTTVLLSTSVATLRSSFCSLLGLWPHPLILLRRRRTVLHYKSKLYNYHINFIFSGQHFEVTSKYRSLRKARAVLWWSRIICGIGMRPYNIGFAFNKLSRDIGFGCITAPSLNRSRPV